MKRLVHGDSRQVKVLGPDGTGHRGYLIAANKSANQVIVLAGTNGEGFIWGRLYRCEERDPKQWHYVAEEVQRVPRTSAWSLVEALLDDRDGHPDF